MTREKLVASDNNELFDIYERSGGTTTLPLVDSSGASVPSANLQGISADGSRIFFGTTQSLVPADTDSMVDLYERTGSVTTLVSLGPNGGNGAVHVATTCCPPSIVSADGSRVFFYTSESLVNTRLGCFAGRLLRERRAAGGLSAAEGCDPVARLACPGVPGLQLAEPHARPALAFGSCGPPAPESTRLTVGSPDANGQPAAAEGFVKYEVLVGNPATACRRGRCWVQARITDVAQQGTLADYTGSLSVVSTVRITDKNSGTGAEPATATDLDMRARHAVRGDCRRRGRDAVAQDELRRDRARHGRGARRSVWELDRVRVFDGGADDNAFDAGRNTLFATQAASVVP